MKELVFDRDLQSKVLKFAQDNRGKIMSVELFHELEKICFGMVVTPDLKTGDYPPEWYIETQWVRNIIRL